ncbi:MAG: aminotransferase class I/II-fold pyridoxal phosphate-dependent enzyme [Candidatus Nanopelagicales bacterium]|nr:aminotransferase class I/II-fold pyridoxal phosphate-dependent enzyme [Candidatus Nanopelagicales bacterium]
MFLDDDLPDVSEQTFVVHAGRPARVPGAPLNSPIVPASSFHAEGDAEYARMGSPAFEDLEAAIGGLERGSATVFSSGMGAANAIIDQLPPQAIVAIVLGAYNGVTQRLEQLASEQRVRVRAFDVTDLEAVRAAAEGAALLWLESPTNPLLDVADLQACIRIAHEAGARVVVDNTIATPLTQRPLELGADYVMHSVTKVLSGHSDVLLGAVVVRDDAELAAIRARRTLLGSNPSAFDCYLALRGLRTFGLRFARMQESARELAARLAGHPAIARVRYPGSSSIISIELAGGEVAADRLCRSTRIWTYATSLGGVESLLERRRRAAGESHAVPPELVRLSVGIEGVEDLWEDLAQALER